MADGPWTAYQQPAADNADGPWTKYKPDASGPAIGSRSDQDRLPSAGPASAPGQTIPTMTIKPEPAGALERFATGVADPFVGAAQLAAHAIPQSVGNVLEKANDWMADATGSPRSPRDLFSAKGADEAVERREKEIAQREPKGTDWWRVAGNVASPANYVGPAGAGAEANIARRVLSPVLQGATAGALQPTSGKDFASEKTAQAIVGGLTGAAAGAATAGVRSIANWAIGLHGDAATQSKAVKSILRRIEEDQAGGGASFQDMLDIANATPDKPLVLADVLDNNAKGLLGKIARAPGSAMTQIRKFINERDIDTATRVTGDLSEHFGQGSAYYADQSLQEARSKAAKPLYERAFSTNMPLDSEYLNELRETNPRIQQAMRKGWAIERDEAQGERRPLNATDYGITAIGVDPVTGDPLIDLGQVPNLRLWNVVKKGLDAQIEAAKDPQTGRPTQEGVAISKLKNGLLRELDRLSPDYRAARDAWAGPTASMSALRDGQRFASMQPEEIEDQFRKMGAGEREFFKLGAANAIRKMMLTTGERGDETRKLMLPYTRMQMRAMFDDDASFDRYFASLNAEHKMWQTWAHPSVGSQTAERTQEDMRPDAYAASQAIHGVKNAFGGRWPEAVANVARAVGKYLPKDDPKVAQAQAKLLTTPVPQAIKTLQGATNGMPTIRIPHTARQAASAVTPGVQDQN